MGRHIWSEEVKAEALRLLSDPEQSYYDVHKATGVPASTLHDWAAAAGMTGHSDRLADTEAARKFRSERIAVKRAVIAEKFLDYVETFGEQAAALAEGLIEVKEGVFVSGGRDALALIQAADIAMKAHRLEMGESTSRGEVIQSPRRKLEGVVDELASRRVERASGE
jgi:transposase-like protein